jgi:hypothetical protein
MLLPLLGSERFLLGLHSILKCHFIDYGRPKSNIQSSPQRSLRRSRDLLEQLAPRHQR